VASPLAGGEPRRAGRQKQAGSFSPQAAKFVQTIFKIEHILVMVSDL